VVLESAYQIGSGVQWLDLLLLRLNPSSQLRKGQDVEDVVRDLLLGVLLPGDEDRRAESRGPPRVPPLLDLQYAQTRQAAAQGRPATGGKNEGDSGDRGWRRRA
jgi:hypothetical protein